MTEHALYLKNLISEFDEEIEQLKSDTSCKKDIQRIITNIFNEFSHEYEEIKIKRGFQFRISGGNITNPNNGCFIFEGDKRHNHSAFSTKILTTGHTTESLTFNGVDFECDINKVIKMMCDNELLPAVSVMRENTDNIYDSYKERFDSYNREQPSVGMYLSYMREFFKIVRADDIAGRITEGMTNKQLIEQVKGQININISYYLHILQTTRGDYWNQKKETGYLHDVVLDINFDFDISDISDRINILEHKKSSAMILLG
jgi:hypothetical protein